MRRLTSRFASAACALAALAAPLVAHAEQATPHNVIIFVADGLRYGSVTKEDAPALAALKAEGVDFANSHSIYPTFTTVNAASLATGHYPGDTGNFANTLYPGADPLPSAKGSRIIFLEDDNILRDMNARFEGNYLTEQSLLAQAAAHGFSVAALGKTGPAAIQDLRALTEAGGLVFDEHINKPQEAPRTGTLGPALPKDITDAMAAAGIQPTAPARDRPNRAQQDWFVKIAAEVVLPHFEAQKKPFVMLFWSADPDTTQHGQSDSLNSLTPGINGPTSRAAVANASNDLERLRAALVAHHLDATTDVIVVADHGFSTIARDSTTSPSLSMTFTGWDKGKLAPGFVAIDLAHALGMTVFDPAGKPLAEGATPPNGSALIGADAAHPSVIVAANGGSDLIYLPTPSRALARKIVAALTAQDYVASIFLDDRFGRTPGALPLSVINFIGEARTPRPAIVVGFVSKSTGCEHPEMCAAETADTPLREGQGMHGSFSRGDTRNFMAATGPDFAQGLVDPAPVSNADIAPTVAHILGFPLAGTGKLKGRVITEALKGGTPAVFTSHRHAARPATNGFATLLDEQRVGTTRYFDAAGAKGRTVGLKP